ncbi:peptidase M14 [Limimaricola cinnabarinus]|uniref:peptidase M14 n=1 Tax=Limimaricola cinnabarinus TaxID=1125964 RepID=UPI002FE2AF05
MTKRDFARMIDALPGTVRRAWLFEGPAARRAMEARARAEGRDLRLHSAYKTLLHDVLEQGLLDHAPRATIHYPVVEGCPEDRFRLECYPLHALVSQCEITFAPRRHEGEGLPFYEIETPDARHRVPVPVRRVALEDGSPALAACGWIEDEEGGRHLPTEYEAIFETVCDHLREMPLDPLSPEEPEGPFFDRLEVIVELPYEDQVLPVGSEVISLAEAMHEEIYFTALEIFQARLGLAPGQRSVKAGQIVPLVRRGETPKLRIAPMRAEPLLDRDQPGRPGLDAATQWLYPAQISAHLAAIGGAAYATRSRQGRPVEGRHVEGSGPARVAISAGQHANETSPMVGALRAGRDLAAEGEVSFTLNPLENPDGYALFRELCADNPRHMHHAARYTASGADLSHGAGRHESAIRDLAHGRLPAKVHVNLHGYPSHEWTRPLTGYIPRGFGQWTIPKGFFLILRHDPAQEALAREVLRAGLDALAEFPELAAQNRRMLELYRRYVGEESFEVHAGCIPFTVSRDAEALYPVTLITEAADETVGGEDFRIAQEGQYRVVRAVAGMLQRRAAA